MRYCSICNKPDQAFSRTFNGSIRRVCDECYTKPTSKQQLLVRKYRQTLRGRFSRVKEKAKERNLSFTLAFEEWQTLVEDTCLYCGLKATGIDRLDSSLGYEKDNCAPCCKQCNRLKSNLSVYDFCSQIERIYKYCIARPNGGLT